MLVALFFKVSSAALCLNICVCSESYEQRGGGERNGGIGEGEQGDGCTCWGGRGLRHPPGHPSHPLRHCFKDIIPLSETSSSKSTSVLRPDAHSLLVFQPCESRPANFAAYLLLFCYGSFVWKDDDVDQVEAPSDFSPPLTQLVKRRGGV